MKPFTVFWKENLSGRGIYTGTAEQVREWLESPGSDDPEIWSVRNNLSKSFTPAKDFLEELTARRRKVMDLVKQTMDLTVTAGPTMDNVNEITEEITKLFEGTE